MRTLCFLAVLVVLLTGCAQRSETESNVAVRIAGRPVSVSVTVNGQATLKGGKVTPISLSRPGRIEVAVRVAGMKELPEGLYVRCGDRFLDRERRGSDWRFVGVTTAQECRLGLAGIETVFPTGIQPVEVEIGGDRVVLQPREYGEVQPPISVRVLAGGNVVASHSALDDHVHIYCKYNDIIVLESTFPTPPGVVGVGNYQKRWTVVEKAVPGEYELRYTCTSEGEIWLVYTSRLLLVLHLHLLP